MNFLGLCFKLKTEVVAVGIGGWREKKKMNAWVEVFGFGRVLGIELKTEMNNVWYEMMKWCEAGRLTRMFDMVLKYGPTKSRKNWVMRSWKHVPNWWGWGNWDILSDEWGKLREEWWVMSDGFFKTKQPLVIQLIGTLCFKQEHPIFNLPTPKTDLSKTKVIKFYFI